MVLFFITVVSSVGAQEKVIRLTGKIRDSQTGDPIPFVNIRLHTGSAGTATNSEGEFIFKIPVTGTIDTLIFSCVGYTTVKKPLWPNEKKIIINLTPAIIELAEVSVRPQSGLDMLKEAIRKIPENYDTSTIQLTAFYRENIALEDFELTFNEAILEIYRPFKTAKQLNDQIRVVKGRKKAIDYGKEAQLYFWISGVSNGARGSLSEDLVKYRRAKYSPFNPVNFKYYIYEYAETLKDSSQNLIVLNINPKKNARKAIMRMKLFLDEESLAIVKYNFELSEQGIKMVSRKDKGLIYAIMTKVVHATLDYDRFQYTVSYRQHHNKWYLNRVTRHWESLVDSKKRNWEDKVWRTDTDLLITDIDTKNVKPITEGNIGANESPIQTFIGGDFDDAFWENYNILKTESTDSLKDSKTQVLPRDSVKKKVNSAPNRQNGFTRADTLRGKLTPLRTCYDVTFYHLDVAVDMDQRSVKGSNLIRFHVDHAFNKMQIDLYANMKIDSVVYKGNTLDYRREYDAVFIDFPETLARGSQSEIKIFYEGIPKTPDWSIPMDGGVLWDVDSLGNPWAQVVCQGSGASLWWPNKDHLSDEPDSMKIWIAVPSQFIEISNGRLQRKTPLPNNETRYEWYVSYPINNYNVTFNIGKYAHYTDRYISDDTLTIDYYVMDYNVERSKKMFKQVHPMLESFEKNFGKYPFKRDGFTLVESLYPMEHQSGVCIGKITQQTSGDTNPLLWHEVAHEWWGNAISCKDIADLWMHEAFATYAEIQVIEHRFGKDAIYRAILDQHGAVRNVEPITGVYDVNHIFYDIGDMYSKGSLMLHTFRNILDNDTIWVNLLRDIQRKFRYRTLSANDLITFINERTKNDYTYFFEQYLKYTTLPILEIQLDQQTQGLVVKYRWIADVKNFRMPIKITSASGNNEFIFPSTEWKSSVFSNITIEEFEVDEENFLIEVLENE